MHAQTPALEGSPAIPLAAISPFSDPPSPLRLTRHPAERFECNRFSPDLQAIFAAFSGNPGQANHFIIKHNAWPVNTLNYQETQLKRTDTPHTRMSRSSGTFDRNGAFSPPLYL